MTTITLEVPDDLASQFKISPAALPSLIREAVASKFAKSSPPSTNRELASPAYQEIIDLLTSGPTPDQLLAFKISTAAQERLEELLDKNREEEITAEERAEINTYARLSEYLTKLKARVRAGQPLFG
ncbi:MAG: hypothetical protein SF097_16025 [Acidobacteriota bacterium]|nr:hypothetical protein [Acidobacteriota bacterium]